MTEETAEDMMRKLEILNEAFADASKAQAVILENALTAQFMRANTRFSSAQEFFDAAEVDYTARQFDGPADDFMQANTQFANWQELLNAAMQQWMLGGPAETGQE